MGVNSFCFSITFIFLIFLAVPLFASPATGYRADCRTDKYDFFDPSLEFLSGPNQHKCLDTSFQRSIVILNRNANGSVRFANFRHAGRYWVATLNPAFAKEIIFQIESFPAVVPAAHTELRIRFDQSTGVKLVEQAPRPGETPRTALLQEIDFSVEAVKLTGDEFDIFDGLTDHYAIAYRFLSMADQYQKMIVEEKHKVRQLSLKLTPRRRAEVVRTALETSDSAQMYNFYNTLKKSCTTEEFDILDRSLRYSNLDKIKIYIGSRISEHTYYLGSKLGLAARGLLKPAHTSVLPNMDKDTDLIETLSRGH